MKHASKCERTGFMECVLRQFVCFILTVRHLVFLFVSSDISTCLQVLIIVLQLRTPSIDCKMMELAIQLFITVVVQTFLFSSKIGFTTRLAMLWWTPQFRGLFSLCDVLVQLLRDLQQSIPKLSQIQENGAFYHNNCHINSKWSRMHTAVKSD